jgi:two-component system, LytTR family, sensor kinase
LIFGVYAVIGTVVNFARLYILERSRFYKASAISRQLELDQLKTQLNPHFLFNSLNNIYSYNLENHRHGNDLILKLAELVRFILETAPREMITVREELLFIENFIAFERERIGHRCEIRFIRKIQFADRQISPLVMFPFIENAFKHGTDTDRETSITIEIQDSEDRLELYVKNDIIKTTRPSPRIGLSNIEKRLSILFPGRYQLNTSNDGVHYAVNLVLT